MRIAQLQAQVDDEWVLRLKAWLSTLDAGTPAEDCRSDLQGLLPEYSAL